MRGPSTSRRAPWRFSGARTSSRGSAARRLRRGRAARRGASDLRRARRGYRRGAAPAPTALPGAASPVPGHPRRATSSGRSRRASRPWHLAELKSSGTRRASGGWCGGRRRGTGPSPGQSAASRRATRANARGPRLERGRAFVCAIQRHESALRRGLPRGPFVTVVRLAALLRGRRAPGHRRLSLALARRGAASQGVLLATVPFDVFALAITDKNLGAAARRAVPPAEASKGAGPPVARPRVRERGRCVPEMPPLQQRAVAGALAGARAHGTSAPSASSGARTRSISGAATRGPAPRALRACSRGGAGGCDVRVDVAPDPKYLDVAGRAFEKRAWSMNSALDAYVAALLWAFGTLTARDRRSPRRRPRGGLRERRARRGDRRLRRRRGDARGRGVGGRPVAVAFYGASSARRATATTSSCPWRCGGVPRGLRPALGRAARRERRRRLARLPDNLRRDFVVDGRRTSLIYFTSERSARRTWSMNSRRACP